MATLSKPLKPRDALRKARESAGLTQKSLAEAAGVTTATISDLENGRNHEPSHAKVIHIFRALQAHGMSSYALDDLFTVSDISPNTILTPRRKKGR